MAHSAAEHKNKYFKESFQAKRLHDSQNNDYGSQRRGLKSPLFLAEHTCPLKADDTHITPIQEQRAPEVISLQLNDQAIPMKLITPTAFPS